MAKVGRPPHENPANMVVSFRVTHEEYHWLQTLARKRGCSLNYLLRFMTLTGMPRNATTPAKPKPE
jgi:hypothetical protein